MNRAVRRTGAIALLVGSFVLAALVIHYQHHAELAIRSLGYGRFPLAIAIFALVASAPFSVTDALAIMDGAIFGPLWGSAVNAIGLVFAAVLGYWINSRASNLLDLPAAIERLPRWVKRFPVGSPAFLICVRIIPGFGGTVATATAATFRVPMWVHVWTMCAIAIPICTLLAIFGDRVTVFVHSSERQARIYYMHHHPHWHFRHARPTAPALQVTPPQ